MKNDKMSSVLLSCVAISFIFAVHVSNFFYHIFTVDINFVDNVNAEICDNSLFTFQFRYIEKLTYFI